MSILVPRPVAIRLLDSNSWVHIECRAWDDDLLVHNVVRHVHHTSAIASCVSQAERRRPTNSQRSSQAENSPFCRGRMFQFQSLWSNLNVKKLPSRNVSGELSMDLFMAAIFFHWCCICFLRGGSLPPAKCWLDTSPMDKNSPEIMSDEVLTWIVKKSKMVFIQYLRQKSSKYLQYLPFLISKVFKLQLKTPLCCSKSSKSRHHDFHHHHTMDRIIAAASDSGTSEHMRKKPKRGHSNGKKMVVLKWMQIPGYNIYIYIYGPIYIPRVYILFENSG